MIAGGVLAKHQSFVCSVQDHQIKRVSVYPSDYGLERMAKEAVMGPQPIFASSACGSQAAAPEADTGRELDDDDQGDDAEDTDEEEGDAEEPQEESSGKSDDEEVNQRRLRMYECSKLRYYFAIVECDSAASASNLYSQCDGLEFELTANR